MLCHKDRVELHRAECVSFEPWKKKPGPLKGDRVSIPHYNDVIMSAMVSQITSLAIAYSTIYSGTDQSKHLSSASLAFVRGIHR